MNQFELELDAIRIGLYEATKDMTSQERLAYLRSQSAPIHKELGMEPISTSKIKPQPTGQAGITV
ncbi:MAG: hypothetical protein LBS96_08160 [Oscillospiraceae bacterium]|jgi:hypothetical protein|nr:hypothetical protein [Oscillospiraceae bacterium]